MHVCTVWYDGSKNQLSTFCIDILAKQRTHLLEWESVRKGFIVAAAALLASGIMCSGLFFL